MPNEEFWADEGWINVGKYSDLIKHGEDSTVFLEGVLRFVKLMDDGLVRVEGINLPPIPTTGKLFPAIRSIVGVPVGGESYDVNIVIQRAISTS